MDFYCNDTVRLYSYKVKDAEEKTLNKAKEINLKKFCLRKD